jgi:hypothetical protein
MFEQNNVGVHLSNPIVTHLLPLLSTTYTKINENPQSLAVGEREIFEKVVDFALTSTQRILEVIEGRRSTQTNHQDFFR